MNYYDIIVLIYSPLCDLANLYNIDSVVVAI